MNPSNRTPANTVFFGVSPGIKGIHNPGALPIDTAALLLRAEQRSIALKAGSVLHLINTRIDGDQSDIHDVHRRTERLRRLVAQLTPDLLIRTQTELAETGIERTIAQFPMEFFAEINEDELRRYTHLQTASVWHIRQEMLRAGRKGIFEKFGWILGRKGSGIPDGGEAKFDRFIPRSIEVQYTAPGYTLDDGAGKAPYLLGINETDRRICIPETRDGIPAELAKIKPGIRRISFDTLHTICRAILKKNEREQLNDPRLITMPLSSDRKEEMNEARLLEDLQQLLEITLQKLLL